MKLKFTFILIFWGAFHSLQAQFGGENIFSFLYLSPSASLTALGENSVAHEALDPSYAWFNPAALNEKYSHQSISFQHQFLFQGIQNGYAGYAHHFKKISSTFHAGIKYADYGEFDETDELGNAFGVFSANELSAVIGVSHLVNERIRVGLNTKFIGSYLGSYSSTGIAFDLGGQYFDEEKKLVIGVAIQNTGFQLSSYTPDYRGKMPVNLAVGVTKQLEHVPFRIGILAHSLHNPDMRYVSPYSFTQSLFGEPENTGSPAGKFIDNVFRHLIISGEFLFGQNENFNIRLAYNHLRKKEMQVLDYRSLSGFSGGIGVRMNRLKFDYSYSVYHLAGGTHHLGITTNIKNFRKKNPLD